MYTSAVASIKQLWSLWLVWLPVGTDALGVYAARVCRRLEPPTKSQRDGKQHLERQPWAEARKLLA